LTKDILVKYGIVTDYTGIANEPNAHDNLRPEETPVLIRYFHEELGKRNLRNDSTEATDSSRYVKIIAPETSNVDGLTYDMIGAILDDPVALAVLDAFSTHSYNMCVVKDLVDWIKPAGKGYWQTECSANGAEDFNDSVRAAHGIARCISDINLGVDTWIWFLGYEEFDPNDNATRIMGYDGNTGEYRPFLKFFYYRQFARAFDIGAHIRLCTSEDSLGERNNQYMENQNGRKPAVCAMAAQNPNGEWGFAVVNQTGIVTNWSGSTFDEAADYDVTFHVEELVGQPGAVLKVMRVNSGIRNVITEEVTVDQNGEFTVTVSPETFVCMRSGLSEEFHYVISEFPPEQDSGPCGMGFGLALLPPLGLKCASVWRRVSRRRKSKNATQA
jgi:hypothetical protein